MVVKRAPVVQILVYRFLWVPIYHTFSIGTGKSTWVSSLERCRGVMADNLAKARLLAIRREREVAEEEDGSEVVVAG